MTNGQVCQRDQFAHCGSYPVGRGSLGRRALLCNLGTSGQLTWIVDNGPIEAGLDFLPTWGDAAGH